ncbi:2'-5' RNA ligase family protein [Candidatus Uhrbacteria bacterium]|nr:2'-5' RNA ligase family protein [Candidatus Uhrbacteria bacterium]
MARQSISCNIAIIPPLAIAKKAIAASRRFKKQGGLYVLDGKNYFPHVTLYMTEFPKKNLPAIKEALHDVITRTTSFPLTFSRNYHDAPSGFIVAHFRTTKAITTLHRRIVRACNPFREGLIRPRDQEALLTLTKRQQQNLLRYGYRDVYTLYHPHCTFSRLPPLTHNLYTLLSKKLPTFSPIAIGLFQSGEHGTCKKLLAKFSLNEWDGRA